MVLQCIVHSVLRKLAVEYPDIEALLVFRGSLVCSSFLTFCISPEFDTVYGEMLSVNSVTNDCGFSGLEVTSDSVPR